MIADGLGPPPTAIGNRTVVAAELASLDGRLRFDTSAARATAEVTVALTTATAGCPAFDLRQSIATARLDGEALDPGALGYVDLGGGTGALMRVLDRDIAPGERHVLELEYELGAPAVEEPRPIVWGPGSISFDVWCSDLYPARYLEQWLPVGLCQDRFALTLDIELVGAGVAHQVIANAATTPLSDHRWRVAWPADHTSLSSMLVIAPAGDLESATATTSGGVAVELTAEKNGDADSQTDPQALADAVVGWLEHYDERLGRYAFGRSFVAHVWSSPRGMEYDGATTASVHSLEHEVFHSWFGRGVKPAAANDGWIDEAITTWCTAEARDDRPTRLAAVPFPLDEPPVLLSPPSPWSRVTPAESYRTGSRLFADLAYRGGGADAVLDALSSFFELNAGGFVATPALEAHLAEALGLDVTPWWDRYVRAGASAGP